MSLLSFLPTRLANALRWPKGWFLMRREWNARISDVLSSPDNARLPRVADAGKIKDGWQTMHNGLRVSVGGYYGNGITRMLKSNKGCHEPQEEIVFAEVLKRLPANPVMIECGAYWAFYSMWFLKSHPEGRAFMIEPDPANLAVGKKNFLHNGFSGHFEQAGLGEHAGIDEQIGRIVSVPSFMSSQALDRANILHMDIQGAEEVTLRGALPLLESQLLDYVFVSTHSEALHAGCVSLLTGAGYEVDASVPPAKSYSVDGVIVARAPLHDCNPLPSPSEKRSNSR
ncbi:MAG: hypothetical protein ACOYOF_06500 [Verrucomicrobiaceae bacterium]